MAVEIWKPIFKVFRHRVKRKAGVREAQIEARADWQGSSEFDEAERALLAYTDSMTGEIYVPDAVFAAVRKHFHEREITEFTATIAAISHRDHRVLRGKSRMQVLALVHQSGRGM
ncbi:MAG: hypothetical protein A3G24_04705 [Betaproteobacteria bacterium RIFCSPLOWO2_12_FULL_62_13]|nr:MAG: hypothetical protein A3G24_04705 [Betaproteobacteria bacterium RIFCSPLOWO2_12_FULL_62_13]